MIETNQIFEALLVTGLFLGYVALWLFKRRRDIRKTGRDPKVLARATTPVQVYFAKMIMVFTLGVLTMFGLHTFGPTSWAIISRFEILNSVYMDISGALVGVLGLSLCLVAQTTMGSSWRVGIDNENQTLLVTNGIFRWTRNPTYLGLFIMNFGVWLIWPTAFVATYALVFFVVMEIQVRCEEEYLLKIHGDDYASYSKETRRYLPWIY
jgi:protein-S-isoprenylcysteine O-methyltransferase Ste14